MPQALTFAPPATSEAGTFARRGRWEAALFAGLGVGFSYLIFDGLQQMIQEKSEFKFSFVCLLLLVATIVFLDRTIERVGIAYGLRPMEFPEGRKTIRWIIVVVTLGVLILHKSLDAAIEKDPARALGVLLAASVLAGSITAAWIKGAQKQPPRAARRGALVGGLIAAPFGIVIAVVLHAGGQISGVDATPSPDLVAKGEQAVRIYAGVFAVLVGAIVTGMWALMGYVGGKAIDKRWHRCGSRGVLYSLTILSCVTGVLPFLWGLIHGQPDGETLRPVAMSLGWGMGLVLHGEVCDCLMHSEVHEEPAAPAKQLNLPAPARPPESQIETATLSLPNQAAPRTELVPSTSGAVIPARVETRPKLHLSSKWKVAAVLLSISLIAVLKMPKPLPVAVDVVNFFESGGGPVPRSTRRYQTHFRKDMARYIEYELHLVKKEGRSLDGLSIDSVWHWADGTDRKDSVALPNSSDYVSSGRGFVKPGKWPVGDYSVDFFLAGKKLASGQFSIVAAPPKDAPVDPTATDPLAPHNPGPYRPQFQPGSQIYNLPELNANADPQLRFFEGLKPYASITQTPYASVFFVPTTRRIWWEVGVTFVADGPSVKFPIRAACYRNENVIFDRTADFNSPSQKKTQFYVGSFGADTPGWAADTYHVDLFIDSKKVAAGDFAVR